MMGTRSGTVDPGMLVYLLRHKGLDVNELDHALNYQSGLLGALGRLFRHAPGSVRAATQSGRSTRY